MRQRIVVGLTGSFGSGCSTVARILQQQGFKKISTSSFLEKEAQGRGYNLANLPRKKRRRLLQSIGNDLRKKDRGILIKKALPLTKRNNKDIVIESIKNPGEILELKKIPNAYIITLDTSFETRVNRILDSEYKGDRNQFEIDDQRERDENIPYGQKVQECVDLSDIIIRNDKVINTPQEENEFRDRMLSYVKLIREPGYRYPTDMELWMNNAYSNSLQSFCLKRQVGAIITKEGFEVASGKNDVPPGERACKVEYKGKCYRDELRKKIKHCLICGGLLDKDFNCKDRNCEYNKNNIVKLLDKCRSLHAEENAILQASRLGGVSLKNSTLYTTTFPCKLCANKIIKVGIKEIIYVEAYPDLDSIAFLKRHSKQVKVTKFEGVKTSAFYSLFKGQKN